MVKESDRGSYCQLNIYEDNSGKITNNDRPRKRRKFKAIRLTQRRTLFTRRDCILVSVVMVGAVIVIAVTLGLGLPRLQAKRDRYYDVTVQPSSSTLHKFSSSAAASDGGPCAAIGKSILDKGGSAVDAAVAMVFCGGVVNPTSTGLGGGFLMTIYDRANQKVQVLDARETAPAASTADMYHSNSTLSRKGGMSVAVPGELRGLQKAHDLYGQLNWTDLVMPSVQLCRDGVPVSPYMASRLNLYSQDILADPGLRLQFTKNETGELYKEGDLLKRPLLGDTLEKVALGGADAMYLGDMASTIIQEIQSQGGIMTVEDLQNYTAEIRPPIALPLPGGKDVFYSVPPPGSGAVVALILNILSGYGFNSSSVSSVESTVLTLHRMVESYKFAFAQRSHLGDTDYVNVSQVLLDAVNPQYGSRIRSRITDDTTHPMDYYGSEYMVDEDHGTAHCQVLAANGDAVTVTSTINSQFGSKFASPSTGIIFNNEMDDFSSANVTNYFGLAPSKANFIQPGKRPLSSMSPSVVVNKESGDIRYVLGGNGGTRIITALVQVLSNMMWFGKDVKQAIDEPRFHHQLYPEFVQVENTFQQIYRDRLKELGHEIIIDPEGSVILGIVRDDAGAISANIDFRKGGSADGI